jgi:hypothetical protein
MSSLYKVAFGLILLQSNLSFGQGKLNVHGAKMNVMNAAYVTVYDVSLTNSSSLIIDSSRLKIAGSISSNNNIDVQNGTVEMNGSSSQTIPAASFTANKIKNLVINNNVTLAGEDSITSVLSFGHVDAKTFSTGGYLTLKSTVSRTANVADLTNNDVNSGNQVLGVVSTERYLSAIKKWRFLSIPTSSTQTIQSAWQEGCGANSNCLVSYGTQITGTGGTAGGFDAYSASPSMKTFNTASNTFVAIPNTNTALINNPVNNTIAYMVFVRGDRSATTISSPVTTSVLRTKGVIKQGDQPAITIASPSTAFTAVGNPYPAEIDLRKMTPSPTTATKIYVWDSYATIGSSYGFGAYQTLTYDGSGFSVTPGGGSYAAPFNQNPNYIESGQAFFVGGNSSPYTISFKEDIKSSSGNVISTAYGLKQNIQVGLYLNNSGVTSLMDGIKADISADFSNQVDDNDARKILNSTENVSIKRKGQLLSVERHNTLTVQDTFYLNIGNMQVQNYQWQVNMGNISQSGLNGFLIDNYTQTTTPIVPNVRTNINFSIANIAGSYAADRFLIVFTPQLVLPLSITSVKAYPKNTNIVVEWTVENESNMQEYKVEKSADGVNFVPVNTVAANNSTASNYNWLDDQPSIGSNYYRIKSVDVNGKTFISKVVEVTISGGIPAISIYPNPVKNGMIHLQLVNQPEGHYGIQLINKMGQIMVSKQVNHVAGSSNETIPLNKYLARGIYQVEITQPGGNIVSINVIY